jgi:PAS domain S-box-containing protein
VLRDANLEIVDVNPAFLQLYGFTREQLAARGGYPDNFPAAYVAERRKRIERALAGEESRAETIALRPDGTTFEADMRVIPVRYRGEPHVLTVVRDITERRQRERELQKSEARLRATVEAAFDCIIGMDGEGRIVEFNAAAERCFGHARAAVLGRLLAEVIIPERLRRATATAFASSRTPAKAPSSAASSRRRRCAPTAASSRSSSRSASPPRPTATSSSATCATSRRAARPRASAASSKASCARRRRWKRSASSPAASRTTSTTS